MSFRDDRPSSRMRNSLQIPGNYYNNIGKLHMSICPLLSILSYLLFEFWHDPDFSLLRIIVTFTAVAAKQFGK